MLNTLLFNRIKPLKFTLPKKKEDFDYYYTVVLDIDKFNKWLLARKQNDPTTTTAEISRQIGYGKSYISQILNQEKYDIEVSARFIGTFLKTYGFKFKEIFKIVRVCQKEIHQKERSYVANNYFKRQDQKKLPHTYYSR